jgi:protein-disulfide isomerase
MRNFAKLLLALAATGLMAACSQASGAGTGDSSEMALGNPKAKVTIVEYASVTCPHCARFNEDVFPAFKSKYVDSGKVHYIFREFLTPPENVAAAGFLIARCAGKDKYFSVVDAVFHSQQEMFSGGDPLTVLTRIGRSAGLSDDKVTACLRDEKALTAMNGRLDKAVKEGEIHATPTFVINGTKLEGEQTLAQLDAVIQPMLK